MVKEVPTFFNKQCTRGGCPHFTRAMYNFKKIVLHRYVKQRVVCHRCRLPDEWPGRVCDAQKGYGLSKISMLDCGARKIGLCEFLLFCFDDAY